MSRKSSRVLPCILLPFSGDERVRWTASHTQPCGGLPIQHRTMSSFSPLPELTIPLRRGIAFVPEQRPYAIGLAGIRHGYPIPQVVRMR